ncbi:MAG: HAD hydrolase-like protein [Sporomusaceae bacterium]|nr:HAD hydrolase-like protein [Sporomusaceae bacterium]
MRLKGIIFDFDGTLADTMPAIVTAFRQCLQLHLGKEYSDREIAAWYGPTEEGVLQQLLPDRWESCFSDYLQAYRRLHPVRAFAGIEQALTLLRQHGVRLAIGTGKGRGSLTASLEITGLQPYFDLLETGSASGAIKPAIIGRVLRQWNLPAAAVAYVGDVVSDVAAAREAGVTALSAAWATGADLDGLRAAKPDAVFETVSEFIDWQQEHFA